MSRDYVITVAVYPLLVQTWPNVHQDLDNPGVQILCAHPAPDRIIVLTSRCRP